MSGPFPFHTVLSIASSGMVAIILIASNLEGAEWPSRRFDGLRRLPSVHGGAPLPERVPAFSREDLREALKPISKIQLDVIRHANETPRDFSQVIMQPATEPSGPRTQTYTPFHWAAPGLSHKPLYFEDVPLERYGHTRAPILQPAISGVRFLKSAATLPYQIGLDPQCKQVYSLGYERPGSCAPQVRAHLPWSWGGALFQAGAVVGGVYMFP